MSLRIYCRLGYRINTKYLFSSYVSALPLLSITSHIGHVLKASVTAVLFSSWAIFRSWSFRTLVVYVGIICANPQVFALLTNVYLSFLFVCYFSVLTETYVDCLDGSQCRDYETCCMMDTGHYGCCPLPKAVCCSDEEHCCPEGYRWSYYWMLIYFTLAPILSRESIRGGFLHKWAIYRRQRNVKWGRESARKLMRNATFRAQFAALSLVIFDDSRATHLSLWFKVLYIFVVIAKHAQRSTNG